VTDTGYLTRDTFSATAAQTVFTFTFPYLKTTHVKASVNGITETDFTVAGQVLTFGGSVSLSAGDSVRIFRRSPETFATQIFQATAVDHLDDNDMDTLVKGLLYYNQEVDDRRHDWDSGYVHTAGFTADLDVCQVYYLDLSGGTITIALPPIASVPVGASCIFSKGSPDATQYTVDPDGSELINGAATFLGPSVSYSPLKIYREMSGWRTINVF